MAPPPGHSLLLISTLGILALKCLSRGQHNSTLIFTKENTIRNCSCPTDIRDCDYSLASLLCSCDTALPAAAEPTSYSGRLTIWFTDSSALGLLLNFTRVPDLKLSLCGASTLPTKYLTICGLQRLHISSQAKRSAPEQSLVLHEEPGLKPTSPPGWHPCAYVSFLDMALFNRESSLKSYSIQNVANITSNFPYFPDIRAFPSLSNESYIVTFIY
ncbi:PREDICTED: uncharacterized protein C21orf62 homolog [Miniopterus natalensis]|uniref:uncharacterized protein C21orf62 homolog n=1 Tax=Miniopterus natalensis TaxID=291302 RepID=UPI0007A6B343|nr:PREDICTED: uncharacterized protein C21orf62 homolog [Miniopterus natalensis]